MIKGVGIDTASISKTKKLIDAIGAGYIEKTFTPAEIIFAQKSFCKEEYFATRFAAKEATFKAIAHLLDEKTFDLRCVETLNYEDGAPYIKVGKELQEILQRAQVERLFVSITTEDDYATSIVIAA